MPKDPKDQLDRLRRSLCGDCGVGPFKGGGTRKCCPRWLAIMLVGVVALGIVAAWIVISIL